MFLIKCKHYKEEYIHRIWKQILEVENNHRSDFKGGDKETEWIFRGQKDSSQGLQTTLERAICNMGISIDEALNIESGLIRKFQRQYYHHDLRSPKKNNIIEWLALMRHYGAPVRILDWTYSFYVALFFAIEEAEGDCAVWALNKKWLINRVLGENGEKSILPKEKQVCLLYDRDVNNIKTWKKVFRSQEFVSFVFPLNPFRLNERLVLQQGDLLCPGDISKPFEENLSAVMTTEAKDYKLYKYVIKYNVEFRREILLNLHRMNINRATLFPGLDGFAQALKTLLASPKYLLKPDEYI